MKLSKKSREHFSPKNNNKNNNNCKIGLNIPSNRLRSVSNLIEKEWLELSKDTFKLSVKIHIIQDGLSLWQYLL